MKKKVLHINSGFEGSIGNIIKGIIGAAPHNKYEIYIAAPNRRLSRISHENYVEIGTILGRTLHRILYTLTGLNGRFSLVDTLVFISKINRLSLDIVHLHNLHNCYINLPILFSYLKKKKIKVIWTLHDCWCFTGNCVHFDMIGCQKWETGCYKCPQLRKYPKTYVDKSKQNYHMKKKLFANLSNLAIVTPSDWLERIVRKSFLNNYEIVTIHSGVDMETFKFTDNDFKVKHGLSDKFVLLGVAFEFGERKGIDIFIELSQLLNDNYKIVLVGIPNKLRDNIPNKILCIDRTNNKEELAKIYSAADVFLNPTREEVLGLVNLESLACGTPVITFNTGGSPECIDKTCGSVVGKEDVKGLIEEIERLSKNNYKREACMNRAKLFEQNKKYSEYIELYNKENIKEIIK